jgi:hypothetical protein
MTVPMLVASLMFASLLSPPLVVLLLVGWLAGAHALLLVPLGAWLVGTAWMTANAGVRHHLRRERFLDAVTQAPLDVLDQLMRLFGMKRRGLRAI